MRFRALAAVYAVLDHLLGVIPGAAGIRHEDREELTHEDHTGQEAAKRATDGIKKREGELVQFFKDKGLTVTEIDRKEFLDTVLANAKFETYGYNKADWDKIQAIK